MILIYSTNHEEAPYLDVPLVEHNPHHAVRPIYKKIRKVRGKTGWLLRRYGYLFGAPKNDPEGLGHHAVQIGAYVYELTREKGLVGQRLSGDQIWPSTVKHAIIGYTDLSDAEIQTASIKAQAFVRGRFGGKYHIKHNNCQHFINEMLRLVMTMPLDSDSSETTTLKSSATSCRSGRTAVDLTASPYVDLEKTADMVVEISTSSVTQSQTMGKSDLAATTTEVWVVS